MTKKKNTGKAKPASDPYRYAGWFLAGLALICYLPVLNLDLTQLDDTIFINDKHDFISHFSNIPRAFGEGCFNEKDIYYRPLLLVYFILLNPFTSRSSIAAYHFGNLFFHIFNVILLFRLLRSLTGKRNQSFWLSAFFCVHPAFTMAVAWIPGINDLLLTTFALGYFLSLMKVAEGGKWKDYLLNFVFLSGALFTKESGAFVPIGGLLLLWYKGHLKTPPKAFLPILVLSGIAWAAWFFARKNVLPADTPALINGEMLSLVLHRATGLLHYFGKCILPFNLTVFPTIESTNILWGLAALVIVAALLIQNKERNIQNIFIGIGWFVLFLLPIFFVPRNVNDQLFEHRLYLPMVGILLLLRESVLFTRTLKLTTRQAVVAAVYIACIVNIHLYMPRFNDTFSFWNAAVEASPESAYANKMLGIKLIENKAGAEGIPYVRKAWELDTNERYTRLFLARMVFIPNNQWDSARHYLQREIDINPKFPDTYADLAQVCVQLKDFTCGEENIQKFLEFKPMDQAYNNNLLLLFRDEGKYEAALAQADTMKSRGLSVNEQLYQTISDSVVTRK